MDKTIFREINQINLRAVMALILLGSSTGAWFCTYFLLQMGVESLFIRYVSAVVVAYLSFMLGVWFWLLTLPFYRKRNFDFNLDGGDFDISVPRGGGGGKNIGEIFKGKGGSFDGGGASHSWSGGGSGAGNLMPVVAPIETNQINTEMPDLDVGALDIDEGIGVVIVLFLLAVVFFAITGSAIFLIFNAKAVLGNIALAAAAEQKLIMIKNAENWKKVLLKQTWKPFVVLLLVFMLLAGSLDYFFPEVVKLSDFLKLI